MDVAKQLYMYKGQFVALTPEQVATTIASLEKSLRSTAFGYLDQRAFPAQVDEIKAKWPDGDLKDFIRLKARELAGKGNAITMAVVRKAILATGERLAQLRANASSRSFESEMAQVAGEIAVATIFRRAPDATLNPNSVPSAKAYNEKGQMIRVKASITTTNLYVNLGEQDSAEIYVLGLYVHALRVAYLLGYATKDQVKATIAEKDQNYKQIPIEKLKPMSSLYMDCGLTELPAGISMEALPQAKLLPVAAKKELQEMLAVPPEGAGNDFDFLAELGISAPAPAPATTPVTGPATPAPVETPAAAPAPAQTQATATPPTAESIGEL